MVRKIANRRSRNMAASAKPRSETASVERGLTEAKIASLPGWMKDPTLKYEYELKACDYTHSTSLDINLTQDEYEDLKIILAVMRGILTPDAALPYMDTEVFNPSVAPIRTGKKAACAPSPSI